MRQWRVLDLDDPRWATLAHAYGPASDVPELLRALARGDDVWRTLFAALCHQRVADTASFAAVPHVVGLMQDRDAAGQAMGWSLVGAVAAAAQPAIPDDLRVDYDATLARARAEIPRLFAQLGSATDRRWLAVALAAVHGHPALARLIEEMLIDGEAWVTCPACDHGAMMIPADLAPPVTPGAATALATHIVDDDLAAAIRALDGDAPCAACGHRWRLG